MTPENRRSRPAGGDSSNNPRAKSDTGNGSTADYLDQFVGLKLYGGCESCDAYQTIAARGPGVHVITVHHDEWCPEQQGREGRA